MNLYTAWISIIPPQVKRLSLDHTTGRYDSLMYDEDIVGMHTIPSECKGIIWWEEMGVWDIRANMLHHTRIFSVQFTMDSKYVLSGSDDGNIRIWKARASEKLGITDWRERQNLEYAESLKERFKHMDEIRRIGRHRPLPNDVRRADKLKKEMLGAQRRKDENRRKHSRKAAQEKPVAERKKAIIGVAK